GRAVFYPGHERFPQWQVIGAALVLVAVTAFTVARARRQPWLLVGWLWSLGTLVPVIGIIRAGDQAMADRFTYLPHVGLFVMLVWGLADAIGRRGAGRALLGRALAVTERNAVAHTNYGFALLESGRAADALGHFEQAVAIKPAYAK